MSLAHPPVPAARPLRSGPHGLSSSIPGRAVDHEGALVAQLAQRPGDQAEELRVRHAYHLAPGAGRVGEGPEEVHERGDAEPAPHRRHVAHGGMEEGREHEDDPHLLQDLAHALRA